MLFQHLPCIWGSTILSHRPFYSMIEQHHSNCIKTDSDSSPLFWTPPEALAVWATHFWSTVNVYKLLALQHADLRLKQYWEHPLPRIDPAVLCVWYDFQRKGQLRQTLKIYEKINLLTSNRQFSSFFWLCDLFFWLELVHLVLHEVVGVKTKTPSVIPKSLLTKFVAGNDPLWFLFKEFWRGRRVNKGIFGGIFAPFKITSWTS